MMDAVERRQPGAMVSNMGRPTIRWIGNEDGLASDPCWYAVNATRASLYAERDTHVDEKRLYLPPECDVLIRRHWFWQPDDGHTLMSLNLLLNVPPNRHGLLDAADATRLLALTATIHARFAPPIPAVLRQRGDTVTATFLPGTTFDHLILRENLAGSQRIGRHTIHDARTGRAIAAGQTIDAQRYHAFPRTQTDRIEITLNDPHARLDSIEAHLTGIESLPALEPQPAFMNEKVMQR